MNIAAHHPIDCDVHITVPSMQPLLPYMDDYWRDHMTNRGTDKLNLTLTTQPLGAPIMGRADLAHAGKGARQRSGLLAARCAGCLRIAHGDRSLRPHRPGLLQRGHGGNRLPGAERLHRT